MDVSDDPLRLRPVIEDDLEMFRRFAVEPGLIGLDWAGFRDAQEPARDGCLYSRLRDDPPPAAGPASGRGG